MNRDLSKGSVVKSMLLFAIPMILGDLLQQCYNIADTLIVGQFLGEKALAAVGSSFTAYDVYNVNLFLVCVWEVVHCFLSDLGRGTKMVLKRISAHLFYLLLL